MNIHQRLLGVRKSVDYLQKENQGFNFKYVSSSQVIESIRKAMNEHGVLIIPECAAHTVSDHETKKGGHEYFTELELSYRIQNVDDPADYVTVKWYAQGLDDGEKGPGKAYTYGEKYLFLKLFNIPTDKDDPDGRIPEGNGCRQEQDERTPPGRPQGGADPDYNATDPQKKMILAKMAGLKIARDEMTAYICRVVGRPDASSKNLTKVEAMKMIDHLKAREMNKEQPGQGQDDDRDDLPF